MYAALPPRRLATVCIDLFRAIPVLVLLIVIHHVLPFVGIVMSALTAATLATRPR